MKVSNLAVIFVVIAFVIIAVLTNYISLERKTLLKQSEYDTKLIDATKDAVDAFEINTVEWNPLFSQNADSKRRDIMGSINTFLDTLANNMNITGTNHSALLSYIPAIAYTLYDGYYIYSPADVRIPIRDANGVVVIYKEDLFKKDVNGVTPITGTTYNPANEGKILYDLPEGKSSASEYYGKDFTLNEDEARTSYNHILKPFATYSEKIDGKNIVINYTLDNYISIYGEVEDADGTTSYFTKSGYLTDLTKFAGLKDVKNDISQIKYKYDEDQIDYQPVEPEMLEETIVYKDGTDVKTGSFRYVYEAKGNQKVYFDETQKYSGTNNYKAFTLDTDLNRAYIEMKPEKTYKKCVIPQVKGGKTTYTELYQDLQTGTWYKTKEYATLDDPYSIYIGLKEDTRYDYSAINYCVESYVFTDWFNSLGLETKEYDQNGDVIPGSSVVSLVVTSNNDPEDINSDFTQHKRNVIKNVVESNLYQAITSYSRNTRNTEFRLPELTETDWDKILENISIITFLQDLAIGTKIYNNYAIATSSTNKEYVKPDEIYLNAVNNNASKDCYYHMPYCKELSNYSNGIIGYRSIDYVQKSYTIEEHGEDIIYNFFLHRDNTKTRINVDQACYNCLVQRSLYEPNHTANKEKAYNTALAREKYIARQGKLPAEVPPKYVLEGIADPRGKIIITKDGDEVANPHVLPRDGEYATTYIVAGEEEAVGADVTQITDLEEAARLSGLSEDTEIYVLENAPEGTLNETDLGDLNTFFTNEKVSVTIYSYDDRGVVGVYSSIGEGSPYVKSTGQPDNSGVINMSPEEDGEIRVTLNYNKNYEEKGTVSAFVWANIDNENQLTIVTEPKNITGKIRLKFTNEKSEKTYYTKEVFEIPEELENKAKIKCTIKSDSSWHQGEWKVDIIQTDGKGSIGNTGNPIQYYTIKDKTGLKGFANATNNVSNQAKTVGRKFYLIKDIDVQNESMDPINAEISGDGITWFQGVFSGKEKQGTGTLHTIKNIKIKTTKGRYFGLFGRLGNTATVQDLKINNINVVNSTSTDNLQMGGLAGYGDSGSQISNITITTATVTGTQNIGGLIGNSKAKITNIVLDGCTVYTNGKNLERSGDQTSRIGGLAGYQQSNTIKTVEIKNSNIGNNTNFTKQVATVKYSYSCDYDYKYFVGGLVGEFGSSAQLQDTVKINSSNSVTAGYIGMYYWVKNEELKSDYYYDCDNEMATGGLFGKNNSNKAINGSKIKVNCNVSGTINVGGIIGNNVGGSKISNTTHTGTVTASGSLTLYEGKTYYPNVCGGLVGKNENGGAFENCTNNANVTGRSSVGGIAGRNNGSITQCANLKKVEGSDAFIGGIAGASNALIIRSYNTGTIKGSIAGGICGINYHKIKYCYNRGNITHNGANILGGICGSNGHYYEGISDWTDSSGNDEIWYCYNTGTITGYGSSGTISTRRSVGGIAGHLDNESKIFNCWNAGKLSTGNFRYMGGIVRRFRL